MARTDLGSRAKVDAHTCATAHCGNEEEPQLKRSASKTARLLCLFGLGCLLFNYPFLAMFNVPQRLFGVPVLYLYLFVAWALIIGLLALVMERRE
jgi:hypothetical protein